MNVCECLLVFYLDGLAGAKVSELDDARIVHEYVRALDVSVHCAQPKAMHVSRKQIICILLLPRTFKHIV